MSSFTAVAPDTDLQEVSLLQEILTALWEREVAAGVDSSPAPETLAEGEDLQDVAFWRGLQERCEALFPSFVNDLSGATCGSAGFAFYTEPDLPDYFESVGMSRDGWRAVPDGADFDPATDDWTDVDDPAFAHALMAAGDICLAPWIVDDLQRFLGGLRLTALDWRHAWSSLEEDAYRLGSGTDAVCADARDAAEAAYAVAGVSDTYDYEVWASLTFSGSTYTVAASRTRTVHELTLPDHIGCEIEQWGWAEAPALGATFADVDAVGFAEDAASLIQTLADLGPGHPTRAGAAEGSFGGPDGWPLPATGLACPTAGVVNVAARFFWLLRWTFTITP